MISAPHQMGNLFICLFITEDEPAVTCHYHPKTMVCIGVRPRCWAWCGFTRMCYDSCPLCYHTECFTSPKIPRAPPVPPPPNPWQPLIFRTVARVLRFPEWRAVGVAQCAAFSGWLLPRRNARAGSLRVSSWLDSAFLSDTE